jgi:hypothetical protein
MLVAITTLWCFKILKVVTTNLAVLNRYDTTIKDLHIQAKFYTRMSSNH